MRKSEQGLALGTVLACLAALAIILFAAVSAALSHLSFSHNVTNQEHARNLADAAIAEAIEQLAATNYNFGEGGIGDVSVTINGLPDAEGRLSFSRSGDFATRYSTNNYQSDDQVLGALNIPVPGRTIHLIGRGQVGETVSWVECLFYRPPFPDALLATGPVEARSIYLMGIRREGAYSGGDPTSIPPEETMPGNLFSNSPSGFSSGGPSAEVVQGSLVTGSVGSVGSVTADSSTQIDGEMLPNSEARPVPELDILQKIGLLEPNAVALNSTYGTDLTLDPDWFSMASGDLQVNGDLALNGSALLVKGDLTVGRALTGTGIVLVDGDVQIGDGGSNVVTGDQVAIGCTGDFTLQAAAPENNYFKGLVYCEGDFEAKDITVVGATVVNGKNGAEGSARLENVRFIFNPGAVELTLLPPRGMEDGDHTVAVSLTIRPSDVEGEYLADVRAYIGFGKENNEPLHLDRPLTWPDTDDSNEPLPSPLDPSDPNSWYNAFANVNLGDPDDPGFGLPLAQEIGVWADDIEDALGVDTERTIWANEVSRIPEPQGFQRHLRDAIRNTDTTQQVSFNLNNLLADTMGASRVLYWKPMNR